MRVFHFLVMLMSTTFSIYFFFSPGKYSIRYNKIITLRKVISCTAFVIYNIFFNLTAQSFAVYVFFLLIVPNSNKKDNHCIFIFDYIHKSYFEIN